MASAEALPGSADRRRGLKRVAPRRLGWRRPAGSSPVHPQRIHARSRRRRERRVARGSASRRLVIIIFIAANLRQPAYVPTGRTATSRPVEPTASGSPAPPCAATTHSLRLRDQIPQRDVDGLDPAAVTHGHSDSGRMQARHGLRAGCRRGRAVAAAHRAARSSSTARSAVDLTTLRRTPASPVADFEDQQRRPSPCQRKVGCHAGCPRRENSSALTGSSAWQGKQTRVTRHARAPGPFVSAANPSTLRSEPRTRAR